MKKNNVFYYWDDISEQIWKLLKEHFEKAMHICEIGFSSGHFLAHMSINGYRMLTGIELRKEAYEETVSLFSAHNIRATLINENVLYVQEKYDALFSTGLLQCLNPSDLHSFLYHVSQMAPLAIFIVPQRLRARNNSSEFLHGVEGCTEYATSTLPYVLSEYYNRIDNGIMNNQANTFEYYICHTEEG